MSLLQRMLIHDALYWAPNGSDVYGARQYADAVEIKCRWEHGTRETITSTNTEITAEDKVYVDRDVVEGGRLMLGTLQALPPEALQQPPSEAVEIKAYRWLDKIRGDERLRWALL